jgi:hypothetical protein
LGAARIGGGDLLGKGAISTAKFAPVLAALPSASATTSQDGLTTGSNKHENCKRED